MRRHFCTQTLTNFHSLPELTRYTNPLKSKFRAKRLAAESQLFSYILRVFNATADLSLSIISRWWCLCSSNQTAHRPNARRISTPKQNSLPPKSSRIRHERATAGSLFSVGFFFYSPLICQSLISYLPRYPNLYEVRLIPTKRDIAFVEFVDEGSAGVAKDALHNYKLDGENKIKVRHFLLLLSGKHQTYICT